MKRRRNARRERRAAGRARGRDTLPEPQLWEIGPGVYNVALPIPPGTSPDEAQAMVEEFCAEMRARGIGAEPTACGPDTCPDCGSFMVPLDEHPAHHAPNN